jgi:hypothetical protein
VQTRVYVMLDECAVKAIAQACRYAVNYQLSGFNHWGYMGGCDFAERSAKEVRASERSSVQRFTCQREVAGLTECTVDLTSLGVCIADESIDGLTHVKVRMHTQSSSRLIIPISMDALFVWVVTCSSFVAPVSQHPFSALRSGLLYYIQVLWFFVLRSFSVNMLDR